ncbi:MAG: hypothetical protein QOE16_139, partial [Microbacteriaceae bacterium]|nr:hypothetical protein [Microbacteriaceae bacterium]
MSVWAPVFPDGHHARGRFGGGMTKLRAPFSAVAKVTRQLTAPRMSLVLALLLGSWLVTPVSAAAADVPAHVAAAARPSPSTPNPPSPVPAPSPSTRSVPDELKGHTHAKVCGTPAPRHVACGAIVDLDVSGPLVSPNSVPSGYGPSDLQDAYGLNSVTGGGTGRTIAVVDAYDSPTAAADLATYRAQFGLPPCGAGCFSKVNQTGGTVLPQADSNWAMEISVDLAMVSA